MRNVFFLLPLAVLAGTQLSTCRHPPSLLHQVLESGLLRVVTRNTPTTFYFGPEGPLGPEYDLARGFAEQLGVQLEIYPIRSFPEIFPEVTSGRAHMAAAGLSITESRQRFLSFAAPYQEVTPQLVYRNGARRPRELRDLIGGRLEVVADSSHAETLRALARDHPELEWVENPEADSEELLYRLSKQQIDYTVADSTELAINRQYYPELRAAFPLVPPESIAWAFRRSGDDSLRRRASAYLERLRNQGDLNQILSRYYDHTDRFDYVGTRRFMRHIESRLPRYRELYREAGERYGVDWRLLAAIGYQESRWNPAAVSPTGVRGIMMLTQATARQLNIKDRTDPASSIDGGARYLLRVKRKIPARIQEPDRTWLALASYNVGFGHLEDARVLTQMHGRNPDRWLDVREHLPLLSQRKWYTRVRYGYARGWEPVRYVDNIRNYYDILLWMTSERNRDATLAEVDIGGVSESAEPAPAAGPAAVAPSGE